MQSAPYSGRSFEYLLAIIQLNIDLSIVLHLCTCPMLSASFMLVHSIEKQQPAFSIVSSIRIGELEKVLILQRFPKCKSLLQVFMFSLSFLLNPFSSILPNFRSRRMHQQMVVQHLKGTLKLPLLGITQERLVDGQTDTGRTHCPPTPSSSSALMGSPSLSPTSRCLVTDLQQGPSRPGPD